METFMATCTGLFIFLVIWRVTHPYRCSCGYVTWSAHAMFRHLQTGHKYVEHDK